MASQRDITAQQIAMQVRRNQMNRGNFNNFTPPGVNSGQALGPATPSAAPMQTTQQPNTFTQPMTSPQSGTRIANANNLKQYQRAQFTLTFNNNVTSGTLFSAASVMPIELFYSQNSVSKLGNNPLSLIPQAVPLEGGALFMSNTWGTLASAFGAVGGATNPNVLMKAQSYTLNATGTWGSPGILYTWWDTAGNLNFGVPTPGYGGFVPTVTLGCKEVAYRALFEFSGNSSFNISKIKPFFTNGIPQSQNQLSWKRGTFTGGVVGNPNSPQNFFSAFQLNTQIIEIPCNFAINKECGFLYGLNMNEASDSIVTTCNLWQESTIQ